MIPRIAFLTALAFLIVCCSGCRTSRQDVVGRYSVLSPGGSEPFALELRDDGTFSMDRSIHGDTVEWSGDGTWKLINETFLGPGDEAVYLTADRFMGPLTLTRQNDRVCLNVEKNGEYWCKSK
jgi:hypothetical protein